MIVVTTLNCDPIHDKLISGIVGCLIGDPPCDMLIIGGFIVNSCAYCLGGTGTRNSNRYDQRTTLNCCGASPFKLIEFRMSRVIDVRNITVVIYSRFNSCVRNAIDCSCQCR